MSPVRICLLLSLLVALAAPAAAISISQFNISSPEDFNSLAAAGTSSSVPAGWSFLETGASANATYAAGTGSVGTGDTYSFGAAGNADRAFGSLQSGTLVSTIGTLVTNSTGGTITSLTITFTGEQWRLGATNRTDQLDFAFSVNASTLGNGTWTDVNALDFVAPVTTGATGALDGNAVANRTAITHTITGLSLINGASLWLRWTDFNASGSDDGLAIDDFSITAAGGNGGNGQSVPDQLPVWAAALLFGGLLFAQSRRVFHAGG